MFVFTQKEITRPYDLLQGNSEIVLPRPDGLTDAAWADYAATCCMILNDAAEAKQRTTLQIVCEAPELRDRVAEVIEGSAGIQFDGKQELHFDNYTDSLEYISACEGVVFVRGD